LFNARNFITLAAKNLMMQFKILFLILFTILFQYTESQNHTQKDSGPEKKIRPKLVLGIVVENMRPDYIQRYWDKFQPNGFRKLYGQGAVCANVNLNLHTQSYAGGTATLYSGVSPNLHGIVDAEWYDRFRKKIAGCTEDDNYVTVGSDSKSGNASPLKLLSSTITDNLKINTRGKAKVLSAALNRESAIFSAGHSSNGAWWLDSQTGKMVTSSFYLKSIPDWARIFNNQNYAEIYSFRTWNLLLPENEYTESVTDDYIFEKGYEGKFNTFPHSINKNVKSSGNYELLKTIPAGNLIIRDFVLQMLRNEGAGNDSITDIATVVFSSMDHMNSAFGPMSLEMQDTYLQLDRFIAGLVDSTEARVGKDNLLIFLTSNTSASFPVEYLKEEFNLPVNYFNPENAIALLSSYLNITFGNEKWIEHYSDMQIWLDHELIKKRKIDLAEISGTASEFMNQFEGILISITGKDLQLASQENGLLGTLSKSYSRNRSGDILYLLKEGWQPSYKFKKVNYTDQSHIPMVFYGKGIKPGKVTAKYNAIDLVPTLSVLIGIPFPDKCQGRVINEVLK
jgi:predicted AlkP superfamily pyrophosphatase or phosphodiesterase